MSRVLHCIPSMGLGGAERLLSLLAAELVRLGWAVDVALIHGGPNLSVLEASGASIHTLHARRDFDRCLGEQIGELIESLRPDLVQTWLPWMDIRGGRAACEASVPWILCECSIGPIHGERFNWIKNLLRDRQGRWASAVIANSQAGRQYWRERLDLAGRTFLISNLVLLEEIDRCLPAPRPEDTERVLLSAGRLVPEKNFEVLVEAMKIVRAESDTRAWLCGNGPRKKNIERAILRGGLQDVVQLLGYVESLWSRMKAADVFVSLGRFEGRPNTVIEAMACGCPVVVSDIPAHREFLDEQLAVLVPVHDARAVADGIMSVFRDPHAASQRARRARDLCCQWSPAAIAGQYHRAYGDILAAKAERAPNRRQGNKA